jgi:hypothetical protein
VELAHDGQNNDDDDDDSDDDNNDDSDSEDNDKDQNGIEVANQTPRFQNNDLLNDVMTPDMTESDTEDEKDAPDTAGVDPGPPTEST